MESQIPLGQIIVNVVRKDIKNIHLSVYPPTGSVRIAAPKRMSLDNIRVFAISKLGWIKQHQKKLQNQERETPREYLDRESHYVWGKRYLLKIVERNAAPQVILHHSQLIFQVRPKTSELKKKDILEEWYRQQLKAAAEPLVAKWEARVGIRLKRIFVRRMKTKWGSCNPKTRSIRLNTDLARKPRECLEYIVVHEMIHFLEPTHNAYFVALMDKFMPNWKTFRNLINRMPVRHESWGY